MKRDQEKRGYAYAEAMAYLGVKRRAFDTHIRPRLPPPTPCGTSRVFERTDLDRAWEQYRASRGVARNRNRGGSSERSANAKGDLR
jgi:hypothetical protein